MPSVAPTLEAAVFVPEAASGSTAVLDAPPRWRALIERALAKDADDRFQDARALLAAIRAADRAAESAAPPKTAGES
jgi:hypothetical protein